MTNPWGGKPNASPRQESESTHSPLFKIPPFLGRSGFVVLVLVGVVLLWLTSGFYRVQMNERGIVLRFGKFSRVSDPGLNYHWPAPFEYALVQDVTAVNRIDSTTLGRSSGADSALMLTGDENIVEVDFTVLWRIKDVVQYVFSAKNPSETVKAAADSVMREIIAQTPIAFVLTQGRQVISEKATVLLQELVDKYGLGVDIVQVIMERVDPPGPTIDAYRDVQRAKTDQETLVNKAKAYANSIIPEARGQAQKRILLAQGYKKARIAEAEGDVERFLVVQQQYALAPEITRQRLYLESFEKVLAKNPKIITSDTSPQGMMPYIVPVSKLLEQKNYD